MLNTKNSKLYNSFSILNSILIISIVTCLCMILILFSDIISLGILNGIKTCVNVLIPSLLPFMILSSFIVTSGLSERIGQFISPVIKVLFNLPGSTGATILLGLIGGYPVGANGIENLVEKKIINNKQAIRMLSFCVGAGPAFTINVVGCSLLKNKSIGIIIFLSQACASILIGISLGLFSRFQQNIPQKHEKKQLYKSNISTAFVQSCINSSESLINMCMFVIIFSSIISLMYNTPIHNIIINLCLKYNVFPQYCLSVVSSILEVTNGCIQSVNSFLPIEFIAFTISWAGICVHFQILSSLKTINIPYHKFVFQRLVHSITTTTICHYILRIYEYPKSVFSNIQTSPKPVMYSNLSACINLFLLCVIFIITLILKTNSKIKN